MDRESFERDIRRGTENAPLASVSKGVIYFLINYFNKSKECLKFVKIFWTHSHNLHFRIKGLELNKRNILPDPLP